MAAKQTKKREPLGDRAVAERLKSILINAAIGQRSVSDDRQYTTLRNQLRKRRLPIPELVKTHPNIESFVAYIRGVEARPERERIVRDAFDLLYRHFQWPDESHDASSWTGIQSPAVRLQAARQLLPLARAAVEGMIAQLSEPGSNGGPILDHREEAIATLRELHRTLGELLDAVDSGHLDDQLGQGLAAEAARYAKRVAHTLRGDPMPYLSSALLIGVLWPCGLPDLGAYLSGIALAVRKNTGTGAG